MGVSIKLNKFILVKYDFTGLKTEVKIPSSHYQGKNLWLVKAINLNRGRGIKVCDSFPSIVSCIKKFNSGICLDFKESEKYDQDIYKSDECQSPARLNTRIYKTETTLIQKYIENPFLFNNRKFDIRVWVLVTHKLEVFLFKEGHLKLSSVDYDINSVNSYVHLTNFSVQKYNPDFSTKEVGNELSFEAFQKYMDLKYPHLNYSVREKLIPDLKRIIKITMKAVRHRIGLKNRKQCYEIFGYDFILDTNLKPFLLEVNTNPGMEESSPICDEIIPRMIEDSLKLTLESIFIDNDTPAEKELKTIKFESDGTISSQVPAKNQVNGYSDSMIMYDYICSV